MNLWAKFKRYLYLLVPGLAYVECLEAENVALTIQNARLLDQLLGISKKVMGMGTGGDDAPQDNTPRQIDDQDLGSYVRKRERESLNAHVKSLGFTDLDEYERSLHQDAPRPVVSKQ